LRKIVGHLRLHAHGGVQAVEGVLHIASCGKMQYAACCWMAALTNRMGLFMYLAQLTIKNFRKIKNIEVNFKNGLNVIIGENNVGKTAIVDALRALLAGQDEPYPRFDISDFHCPKNGSAVEEISFHYIFRGLDENDEADFLPALKLGEDGDFEAHITVCYSHADKGSRFRIKRWCGVHEENSLTSDMLENLRSVYLPPLRDAAQGLKPSRTSKLSRLFNLLTDATGRAEITALLQEFDEKLKKQLSIVQTHSTVYERHNNMLGSRLSQVLEIGLSANDFQRLAARLSILADNFDIEQNGLGFNNLIFMAVVLSELSINQEASYRSLIIEEPEAHLHPQLQAVLLKYLESIQLMDGSKSVQLFVTSHSPSFASIVDIESLVCLVNSNNGVEAFLPRSIKFDKGKREKLKRYLDVTRAELFFARKIIFVEGAAEMLLVSILAEKAGFKLREHAVSLISVEGLNFDCFLPLFGEKSLKIPVSILTDADPVCKPRNGGKSEPLYPALDDVVTISDNTKKMKGCEDVYVKVFHGVKTFEYDLALHAENRISMLKALKELHPGIEKEVAIKVDSAVTEEEKACELFRGMFERPSNNVQKGRFGQMLAQVFSDPKSDCKIPEYILNAIKHVCHDKMSPT